ncbi:hypothetical protein QQZ08_001436 [Neonectria magnoliae]|uniref:Uncharacterized protein n=1 Tax=Neonectria magnoliae TaxID=2732573 RepID=A0ABR1IG02_9HYPO
MAPGKKGGYRDGPPPMFFNPKKNKHKKAARAAASNMEQMNQMEATCRVSEMNTVHNDGPSTVPPEPVAEIPPDPSDEAYENLLDEIDFIYQVFKLFLHTDCTTAVAWSDDIRSPANAFIELAQKVVPECSVKPRAEFVLGLMSMLKQEHKTRLFVTLWQKYRAED